MIAAVHAIFALLAGSLWQGACIAVAASLAVRSAGQRLNASTRCLLFQIALLAVVLMPLLILLPPLFRSSAPPQTTAVLTPELKLLRSFPAQATLVRTVIVTTSDAIATGFVSAWACGVALLLVRLAGGSVRLVRIVRGSRAIGQRDGITVHASVECRVPLAFGFHAPIVLVPTSLAQTRGDGLECAVLHEIAHIRRHDAWMNVVERITQAILFFNPGAIYLLRAIALERESACDDWAVAQFQDLEEYTFNLARIALSHVSRSSLPACGAAGFHHATISRVRRLEDARRNGATPLSRPAIGGFSTVLFALVLVLQAFAPAVALAPPQSSVPVGTGTNPCFARSAGPKLGTFPIGIVANVDVDVKEPKALPSQTTYHRATITTTDRAVCSHVAQNVVVVGCSTALQQFLDSTVAPRYVSKLGEMTLTDNRGGHVVVSGTDNVVAIIGPGQSYDPKIGEIYCGAQ
jgi:beta-lactamase regulating signal transducer with metallopeptidase domain